MGSVHRRQPAGPHPRSATAGARMGRTRRRLFRQHRVRGRAAHSARVGDLLGDQARRGRIRGVVEHHLRRPGRAGQLFVPDGSQHQPVAFAGGVRGSLGPPGNPCGHQRGRRDRAGRCRGDRAGGRRGGALPDPPASGSSRDVPAQRRRLRPLAARHAPLPAQPDGGTMTTPNLNGRTAIITGGSRGIGLAIAQRLALAGANIVLTSRKQESADEAAQQVGGNAIGVAAHAVDEEAARQCVDLTLDRFGSIDILINNAGTNPAYGPLIDQDHARFAKTFEVNLWAPLLWTSLAVKAWMGEHGGTVVNTASIGGMHQSPNMGMYNATKAALIHVTKQLALELSPRVRVNAICPGVVRTRLAEALWKDHEDPLASSIALGRIGEPADVAEAGAFPVSDGASWITGETMVIDGGLLLGAAQGFQAKPGGAL